MLLDIYNYYEYRDSKGLDWSPTLGKQLVSWRGCHIACHRWISEICYNEHGSRASCLQNRYTLTNIDVSLLKGLLRMVVCLSSIKL